MSRRGDGAKDRIQLENPWSVRRTDEVGGAAECEGEQFTTVDKALQNQHYEHNDNEKDSE